MSKVNDVQALLDDTEKLVGLLSDDPNVNVMWACSALFDKWHYEVFPLLHAKGKNRYQVLAKLLVKNGYANASEALVRGYFSRIRKKRGLVDEDDISKPVVSVDKQARQAGSGVTSPVQNPSPIAREQVTATAPVVSTITPVRPVPSQVVQEAAVIPPVVVGSESGYPPEWWASQRERLMKEKAGMYRHAGWSADDDVARGLLLRMLEAGFIDPEQYEASAVYLGKKMTMYRKMWELLEEKRLVLRHQ
ncbi:hypothetical protein [Paraburkholderia aromaticivorans]|uniref:hypothetical protein n=1 Tax=Paraburkholderia aromaticivorans TaxID=2026199 RepID=UPI0038B8F989